MPSVASQVNASLNQYRDAKTSAAASGKGPSSPFEEMLDSAAAEPAPPARGTTEAAATRVNGTTTAKDTKPADDPPAKDTVARAQADDVSHNEMARDELAERCDAKLEAPLSKALATEAGEKTSAAEAGEQAAAAQKPIVEIGLAAFLEAVASATSPQPETDEQGENAEGEAKADVDANVPTGMVKTDAVAAVATTVAQAAAVQTEAVAVSDNQAVVGASVAGGGASSPEQAAGLPSGIDGLLANAEMNGFEASLAAQADASKVKRQAETTTQPTEAPELQADGQADPASIKPEALAAQQQARQARGDAAEAKAASSTALPGDAPAPTKPFDALQTLQGLPQITSPNVAPSQTPSFHRDMSPMATAVPIEGVAIEIAAKASEGMKSFEIRLDPPELGRIHVRLEVDRNGELTSRVTADRQETLDLLRRDAPQLERALNDAGVRTSNNGLQFSLRDHGQGQQQHHQQSLPHAARLIVPDESLAAELTQRGYYRPAGPAGGIDIRV